MIPRCLLYCSFRSLHVPCIVIKTHVRKGPRSFVMAVNGTQVSKHGLDILLRVVNSRDSVTLIYYVNPDVETAEVVDPLRDYYEHELEEYGPPDAKYAPFILNIQLPYIVSIDALMNILVVVDVCRFVVHHTPRDVSLKEAITNFVNESECDFFAIAPRAKNAMSNMSDFIINHVSCNIILCKN